MRTLEKDEKEDEDGAKTMRRNEWMIRMNEKKVRKLYF